METSGQLNGSLDSSCHALTNESTQVSSGFRENEDLADDIVKKLDSYWEDIEHRLTISRMVSDSVIRGVVNAVEQEAAYKIAWKESELQRLKEKLDLYHVYENEPLESLVNDSEGDAADHGLFSSYSDAPVELEKVVVSLGKLKNDTWVQLKNLRKEIDLVRGGKFMRRINSGSELVGLGGILREGISKKCTDFDVSVDLLSSSLGCVFKQVDNIVRLSKTSFSSCELEHQYLEGIESLVISNCIYGLQEQFKRRLCGQMQLNPIENTNILDKMKEISNFRQELDAISKSLSSAEAGHLMFHGSMEFGDEIRHNRRADHLHHLGSANHVSLSTSLCDGNGKHEESVITVSDNLDFSHLMHMKREELVQHFKVEMTKMKLNHDYEIGGLTEELFTLKAKYLKERDHSLPPKKDKEFDVLRRKIPNVIARLDDILLEYGKLPALNNKGDGLDSLKERLDSLLSENCRLMDMLAEKKKEVDLLSSQVSDAVKKTSELAEANLLLMKENLESAVIDTHIEASIGEDVRKCVFNDVLYQVKCMIQESDVGKDVIKEIYEIVLRDAAGKATLNGSMEFEDSWLESVVEIDLIEIIFKEALNVANEKFNNLSQVVFDKERALCLEVKEKEVQTEEMLLLKVSVKEKEELLQESLIAFNKELEDLQLQRNQQQISMLKCSEESNNLKCKLSDALERIKLHEVGKVELNEKFDQAMKQLRDISEERRRLLAVVKENKSSLSAAESREKANREQMESVSALLQGLLHRVDKFKEQVESNLERTDKRLHCLDSQLHDISQKANMLKKMGAQCKQRLERKTSDLHKAETEVDLLGDEVDALLSLLEKIYIALDHYSPVLQHYPGIVEILKLVRRELSGESTKHGQFIKKV